MDFPKKVIQISHELAEIQTSNFNPEICQGLNLNVHKIKEKLIKRYSVEPCLCMVGEYLGIYLPMVKDNQICSAINLVLCRNLNPARTSTKSIIYQNPEYLRKAEIIPLNPNDSIKVSLKEAYDRSLIPLSLVNNLNKINYHFVFDPVQIEVRSSAQPQIGLIQYLSDQGDSNQYFRFNEYIGKPITECQNYSEDVFLASLPDRNDFENINLTYDFINHKEPNNTTFVKDKVKVFRIDKPSEPSSLNYIGDFDLNGYLLRIHVYNSLGQTIKINPNQFFVTIASEILSRL